MNCVKCRLHHTRRNIVRGRGSIPADIMFIGEAPGRSEDLLKKAFVGPSGKLLDEMLFDAGYCNVTYYITNTVRCRPTDALDGDNRAPKPDEILACQSKLLKLYNLVKPKMVILVGKIAEKYYKSFFPSAVCIQHPAFLLRQGGKASSWYGQNVRILEDARGLLYAE